MDINQILTPDDSVKLADNQQYQFYFDLVQHAMECVVDGTRKLHNDEVSQQETEFLRICAERLTYTLHALELRFLHIDENTMEIDVTESGFPNYSAFRFLSNEISFMAKEENMKVEEVNPLIDKLVETLMVKKQHISKEKIAQTAFSLFHKTTVKTQLFDTFVYGKVSPSEIKDYDFVAYWMNYDVLYNRPFFSMMYFNIDAINTGQRKYDEEKIIESVKKTVASSPIQDVIYDIDKNLEGITPKLFKRIDIGPFSSIFTKDDRAVSLAIAEGIKSKVLPVDIFCLELKVEKVFSEGVLDTGSRFSFIKKREIQNWSKAETYNYLFAPHQMIQFLSNSNPDFIKNLSKHPIDVAPKEVPEF